MLRATCTYLCRVHDVQRVDSLLDVAHKLNSPLAKFVDEVFLLADADAMFTRAC